MIDRILRWLTGFSPQRLDPQAPYTAQSIGITPSESFEPPNMLGTLESPIHEGLITRPRPPEPRYAGPIPRSYQDVEEAVRSLNPAPTGQEVEAVTAWLWHAYNAGWQARAMVIQAPRYAYKTRNPFGARAPGRDRP